MRHDRSEKVKRISICACASNSKKLESMCMLTEGANGMRTRMRIYVLPRGTVIAEQACS